jgi:archaemetzincin
VEFRSFISSDFYRPNNKQICLNEGANYYSCALYANLPATQTVSRWKYQISYHYYLWFNYTKALPFLLGQQLDTVILCLMKWLLLIYTAFNFWGCQPDANQKQASIQHKILPVIVVQPLDNFDSNTLQQIQAGIAAFYPVKVVIAQRTNFPQKAWYAPRKRYRADSTIAWLKTIQPANTRCILAITKQDISTTKGQITDFGVMGLGYQPGVSCVVSLYRLHGGGVGDSVVYNRFLKTILHELGHNFGLPHCPDKR